MNRHLLSLSLLALTAACTPKPENTNVSGANTGHGYVIIDEI